MSDFKNMGSKRVAEIGSSDKGAEKKNVFSQLLLPKERKESEEPVISLTDQIEQRENKIKELEKENRKLKEGQEADFNIMMKLLEPKWGGLSRRYVNDHAAWFFADLLLRWIPALQELIGLAHALNESEKVEPQLQQMWAELYLQKVRQIQLGISEAECTPTMEDMQREWDEAKRDGLAGCVQWWLEKEQAVQKASCAVSQKKLVESLRPKLQEIRGLKPEDYLTTEGKRILCDTARLAEDGLRDVGYFPEFYDSESTRKQIILQPELDAAYNEGNSSTVELPAVFLRREGCWELLSGCIGQTFLRKLNETLE